MATRRTRAELDAIAAEAAADAAAPAPEPAKTPARRKKAAPAVAAPATVERAAPQAAAYRLTGFDGAEKDEVYSWTATAVLGADPAVRIVWNGAKKTAAVQPLAKTEAAAAAVTLFEATARRLLPGRDSITDLVTVLSYTAEAGITAFNRVALLRGIPGSAEIAFDPSLITAEAA